MKRPFNFPAGQVFGVQNAPAMVAAFLSQVIRVGRQLRAGEIDAPVHQFLNPGRGFPNHKINNILMAKSSAAIQRILDVLFKAVCFIRNGGNAALRIIRVGFRFFLFGDYCYRAKRGDFDRQTQSCDAAADDEKVRFKFHRCFPR